MKTKIKCPVCGHSHEINPAKLLAELSYKHTSEDQRRARTEKARIAIQKKRKKLSTGK